MTSSPSIRDVLDFWFLPVDHPEHGKPREIWWKGPAEFDAEIVGVLHGGRVAGTFDHADQVLDAGAPHGGGHDPGAVGGGADRVDPAQQLRIGVRVTRRARLPKVV
jgi:hypothetical protein